MSIFETWPHPWFGVWKVSALQPLEVPLLAEIIDESWAPHDLAELVAYVRNGPTTTFAVRKSEPCLVCGEMLKDVSVQQGDGVWYWPMNLAHFVERHHVRFPIGWSSTSAPGTTRCRRPISRAWFSFLWLLQSLGNGQGNQDFIPESVASRVQMS